MPECAAGVSRSSALLSYGVHVLARLILRCSLLYCVTIFFGGDPIFVCAVLPAVQKNVLEDVGEVYLSEEVVDFIDVVYGDGVVLAFGLPAFELTGEGRDVRFGCVTPRPSRRASPCW